MMKKALNTFRRVLHNRYLFSTTPKIPGERLNLIKNHTVNTEYEVPSSLYRASIHQSSIILPTNGEYLKMKPISNSSSNREASLDAQIWVRNYLLRCTIQNRNSSRNSRKLWKSFLPQKLSSYEARIRG